MHSDKEKKKEIALSTNRRRILFIMKVTMV